MWYLLWFLLLVLLNLVVLVPRWCYGLPSDHLVCGLAAFHDMKTYYSLNNGACYLPSGSSSSSWVPAMVAPKIYTKVERALLLFRVVSGTNTKSYDFYTSDTGFSPNISGHLSNKSQNFKSALMQEWQSLRPSVVNLSLQDASYNVVAWLAFNVTQHDNTTSWFNLNNLVATFPWDLSLLKAITYNFFSIPGEVRSARRFFINSFYDGCDGDFGVLLLVDGSDVCPYGLNLTTPFPPPKILYILKNGALGNVKFDHNEAFSFEIWAKYDDSITIMS